MTNTEKQDTNTHFKGKTFFAHFSCGGMKGHNFACIKEGTASEDGFTEWLLALITKVESGNQGSCVIINCKII